MGSTHENGIPMEFPREWELDLNKDRNMNENTTAWEWERLILVGSRNHFCGLVKSHYTIHFVLSVCGFHTKASVGGHVLCSD